MSLKRELSVLIALILFYIAVYTFFYPQTYSILDEQGFLSFALVFGQGTFSANVADIFVTRHALVGENVVPAIGLAMPLLLVPAVLLNWKSAFLVTLLLHLIGTSACAGALRKLKLPVYYAGLYLFFPVAALFSRTVMADLPAAAMVMCAVWAHLKWEKRPILAGLFLGLSLHFRFAQIMIVAGVGLATLIRDLLASRRAGRLDIHRTVWLSLGLLPGIVVWMLINTHLYGGPLSVPVTWPLSTAYISHHLWRYLAALNLFYPLMLVVTLCFRSRLRLEVILSALFTIGLYSCFKHLYAGFGNLSGLLIGYRFFLPLFSLMIIPYIQALHEILHRPRWRFLTWALLAALMVLYTGLSFKHDQRLGSQAKIQTKIYEATTNASLVICEQKAREYFFDGIEKRKVLAPVSLENNDQALLAIERSVPGAYLVSLERTDMANSTGSEPLQVTLARRFNLERILHIDQPPDIVDVYHLSRKSEVSVGAEPE